jgi:small subunit ribosomal protein S1
MITLSKEHASKIKVWEVLENALRDESPIEGKIVGKTKGGFSVDISGINAFLPGSQVDIKPPKEIDNLIGKKMPFRVLKLNNKLSNVIVSRRAILEEEMQKKKAETLERLKEGQIIKGVVKNITDYGVFVDLGGVDGLLHISDISWGRINHPSEFFAVSEEISVIILKYDEENEKVTLGYKQKKPDPWSIVDEKYPVGKRLKVRSLALLIAEHLLNSKKGLKDLLHIRNRLVVKAKHPQVPSGGETVELLY